VIPSERTVLSLDVSDCSLQLRAPSHPGSLVAVLNNVEFAADIIGNSPEMSMRLKIVSGWILAIDNLDSAIPYKGSTRNKSVQASDYWRVRDLSPLVRAMTYSYLAQRSGFAGLLEIRDLGVLVKRNSTIGGILNKVCESAFVLST
jgi:autophagy-related protein 2